MRPGFQRESDMFSHTFRVAICLIGAACIVTTGCSMCCGPFDYDYPTFGGNRPRVDRSHGRVGSPFSDPAGNIAGPSADSNLTPVEPAPDLDLSEGDDFDNGLEEDLGDPEGLGEKEPQSGFDGKLLATGPEQHPIYGVRRPYVEATVSIARHRRPEQRNYVFYRLEKMMKLVYF